MVSTHLFYKGFKGTVNFSEQEKLFYGKVADTDDLITFEGESIEALEKAFRYMIEEHIGDCRPDIIPDEES